MSFKIIAVRPLANCAKNILKNLTPEEFYFLDNSYQPNSNRTGVERREDVKSLPTDFFSLHLDDKENSSSLKNINIQAIVGKNGSGKSSLVELLLRILNNFFKKEKFNVLTNKLRYAKGVYAELYFSIKEEGEKGQEVIYKMTVNTLDLEVGGNIVKKDICKVEPRVTDISKQLFFTMYVNYSLYGLDAKDYLEETIHEEPSLDNDPSEDEELKPWLGRVFHKNDGYQTQLVIHPWREAGQINIRNEKELMRQRLISQIILDKSYKELTDKQDIQSFKFTFRDVDYLKKYFHNFSDFKEISSDSSMVYAYPVMNEFLGQDVGFRKSEFYTLIHDIVQECVNKRQQEPILEYNKFWEHLEGFEDYQYLVDSQLREIAVFSLCFQALEREVGEMDIFKESIFLNNLFLYALVKLRKILKYPRFSDLDYNYDDLNSAIKKPSTLVDGISKIIDDDSHISIKLRQAITILKLSREHPNNPLIGFYEELAKKAKTELRDLTELRDNIKSAIEASGAESVFFVPPQVFDVDILLVNRNSKEDSSENKKGIKTSSWRNISSGEFQKIGLISSLTYHLRNLDSVKRGKNSKGEFYNYENINIILDEIELYFHPEYQRTFIHDLIKRLQGIEFKKIKSVNISFITHSPFILSDVPSQNILKLEDGKPKKSDSTNSFASNIHDLLKDDFFLKGGSMGEFASKKLDELIKYLYLKSRVIEFEKDLKLDFYSIKIKTELNSLLNKHREEIKAIENKFKKYPVKHVISLIGEPVLKNKLMEMFNKCNS